MSVSCQPSPRPLISPTQSLLTPTLLPKPLLKVPHLGSLNCPVSGDPIPQDFAQVTLFQTMFSVCLFGCAGLCCCTRAFSIAGHGSHCGARPVAKHGLQGTQAQYLWHTGLAAHGRWDLPGPQIKPMYPTLQGRLLTTGPPGKL